MTMIDLAKQTGSDGRILTIAEILNKALGIASVPWKQGNKEGGNEYSVRSALPTIGTRAANEGVVVGNAQQGMGEDSAIHLEAKSTIDTLIYDKAEDKAKLLLNESKAFIEAFGQTIMTELFYGDAKNPNSTLKQRFNGIATRLNSTTTFKPVCFKSAGSSNCTSSYLVIWGENLNYGFTGKNMQAGLKQGETKLETIYQLNGSSELTARDVYGTKFEWTAGFTNENWRQFSRFANIDVTALKKDSSAGADLIEGLIKQTRAVQKLDAGAATFYMNRDLITYLDLQQTYKGNAILRPEEVNGRTEIVDTFRRIPVIMVETISSSETAIS